MPKQRSIIALALISAGAYGIRGADVRAPEPLASLRQEVWRTEDGLPQNTVPAILESRDGYVWAGTELGLVRFDGLHFAVFDRGNTPALKSNFVYALLEDHTGALWIGTVGGGLTRYANGEFTNFSTRDGLSNDSISCLLEDAAGDIWIGTNGGGLDRLHNGHFNSYDTESGLPDNQVFALASGRDGTLWIGTHNGLSRFYNGQFRNFRTAEGLPYNHIRSLFMSSRGMLWIGTYGGGLARLEDNRFTTFTVKDGLPSNSITALHEAPNGDLWIGTLGGGLSRLSVSGGFSSYNTRDGLPIDDIWCVYQDHERNFWLGTGGGGLVRLSRTPFVSYSRKNGLSDNVALAVFEDHEDNIWIGTNKGGLNRFRNGEFRSFGTKSGLADEMVLTVGEGPDHSLWIGGRKGLNRWNDGKVETFTKKQGLADDIVTVVYAGSQGEMWVGTRAGLSRFKDHAFETFTTKEGLSSNVVQALYEDRGHRLWIGTNGGGLNVLENGRFRIYDKSSGLPNEVVMAIHEDAHGTIWIGTNGGGLVRLKDNHLSVISTKSGLSDDAIFSLTEDERENLWMSSNKGVFRASLKALNDFADGRIARIPVVSYGTRDGMLTAECNGGFQPAAWKSRDGRLWFPTMHGVTVTDPRKLTAPIPEQSSVIEQVLANDQQVHLRSGAHIAPGAGKLEFHFSAPNLHSASRINFRYQLEGFDPGWVQAGQRRAAYYTNIPPAKYRFRVVASNEDGTWSSAEASLILTLEPHFYQTFFFYVLCGLSVIGAGAAVHLIRIKSLREHERVLERHVAERTAELRNEVAERQRAELESLKAKETAERASQVKGEFLANMSHEIRTPMNGILGMTRLALGSEMNPQQRQYMEVVLDASASLLRVIDDILDFSKVEAGKLEIDTIDFVLREHLESALKSLALQADQKRVKLALSVDPEVPHVLHSDPLRLRQIILNLAGNALKFTDKGSVTVRVRSESLSDSEVLLKLAVIDTGVGIPREKLTSIFGAFSQADSSTTRKFGGTGLGLAICDRLVQLMGGSMWVVSDLGAGSEFHFTIKAGLPSGLPSRPADSVSGLVGTSASLAALSRFGNAARHVLVAEDNPANRMVARLTLEKFGFRVHEAGDGREALDAAQKVRFDVILMDCRMPGIDGYEATRQIRNLDGPAGKVPVIALTASAFKEDRIRAEQAGMNDFIAKPFGEAELVQKCLSWTSDPPLISPSEWAHEPGVTDPSEAAPNDLDKYPADFVRSVLQIFLETAPPVFERLVVSIQNADWEQAKTSAHWLRGGASRAIAPDLQHQLGHIESVCGMGPADIPAAEVEALIRSFKQACDSAEKWMANDRKYSTSPVEPSVS